MLRKEISPESSSHFGFIALLAVIILHLRVAMIGPDAEGHLFSAIIWLEALGQSFLLCAPAFAVYAGLRSLRQDRNRLLPYLAVSGGGVLSLLTLAAFLL